MRLLVAAFLLCALLPARAADAPAPATVQAYLDSHSHAAGVTVQPSGLQLRVIKRGNGRPIGQRDQVQVYYTARLADGRVIDGTSPGLPAPIDLSATLPGLGEALLQMREGDHWELALPPLLAFGVKGKGDIPAGQALVFDLTVVKTVPAAMGGVAQSNGFSFSAGHGESHAYFTIHP